MNRPDTNRIKEGKPVYGAEKACGQRDGVDLRGEGPDGRIPDVRRARTDELSLSGRLRHDTDTRGLHIGMFGIRGQRLFRSADTQERGRAGRVFRCLLFQHLHRLRAVPRAARRHTLSGKLLQRSRNADARPGTVSARSRKLVLQHTEHHPYPPFRLQDHLQIYSVGHAGRKLRGRRHGRRRMRHLVAARTTTAHTRSQIHAPVDTQRMAPLAPRLVYGPAADARIQFAPTAERHNEYCLCQHLRTLYRKDVHQRGTRLLQPRQTVQGHAGKRRHQLRTERHFPRPLPIAGQSGQNENERTSGDRRDEFHHLSGHAGTDSRRRRLHRGLPSAAVAARHSLLPDTLPVGAVRTAVGRILQHFENQE